MQSEVFKILLKNPAVNIDIGNKVLTVITGTGAVGNGTWGKIDYLTNHCKFIVITKAG